MDRRTAIKLMGSAAAIAGLPQADAMTWLRGGVAIALNDIIAGGNLAAGGAADFYFEDLPLTQDIITWSKGFQNVTSPGSIGANWIATDSNGWPIGDFGVYLHHSSLSPAWASAPLFCGYTSSGSGSETITGSGATISSIDRSHAPLVTFQLTPTTTTWGFTITGTSGGTTTGIYAYQNAYSANAANGSVPITYANAAAGKIFSNEAIAVYGALDEMRTMWGQNAWYRVGGAIVQLTGTVLAGATSATLVANTLAPGTYAMLFRPAATAATWDVHTVTISSTGQTAISWTDGALSQDSTAIAIPHSSATRSTVTNVKANLGWGQTFAVGTDGYPLGLFLPFSRLCKKRLWSHIPLNDDGTYYQAHLNEILSDGDPSGIYDIEIDNENWNPTGESYNVLNSLAAYAGQTTAQWFATRLHAVANYGRSIFGSDWNSRIRLVFAWQMGNSAFFNGVLQYMISQGWNPAADIWCLSIAPYFMAQPAVVSTDTTAQVLTKVAAGATFPTTQLGGGQTNCHIEKAIALALWYGMPGIVECYEANWDSVTEYNNSSCPNIGPAIMDPGMEPIMLNYGLWMLDMGVKGFNFFEAGCSADTTAASPKYELSNNYSALVSTGSPRFNALTGLKAAPWTPSRNVIANSGDWIDARQYIDASIATSAGYPTFTATSGTSPVNNYNNGWKIQCPKAVTLQLQVYFTTTAARTMNAYLDGAQVATAVAIPSGLTWTGTPVGSSAPVVFATLTLSKGVHYIELGNIAAIASVTANALQFQ